MGILEHDWFFFCFLQRETEGFKDDFELWVEIGQDNCLMLLRKIDLVFNGINGHVIDI